MEGNNTKTQADGTTLFAGEAWFDAIEAGLRGRVREVIEELLEQELTAALGEAAEGFARDSAWNGCAGRTRHERAEGGACGALERGAQTPAARLVRTGGAQRASCQFR